jgi:hypothetical protein
MLRIVDRQPRCCGRGARVTRRRSSSRRRWLAICFRQRQLFVCADRSRHAFNNLAAFKFSRSLPEIDSGRPPGKQFYGDAQRHKLHTWYMRGMCDINIRNIDPALRMRLKSDAALAGVTLRTWCIGLLGGSAGSTVAAPSPAVQPTKRERPARKPPVSVQAEPRGCPHHGPDCGFPKAGGWYCAKVNRVIA